ncbi:N-6 DNA methylase [Sphaerisporangium sp. TRM90804]|uniref:N-6 DNA methylase n=1 Tax=Sphaerisporangium sp. TRM90804 TaxID=3031113 RepID=UPI00244A644D|nr:N-6 DNA methylase [Sphaerisporangium sp. TRM90804]MDH2428047.1 N-6 DNA methylase [Sphaerisporangium sp. TRM90804]
MGHDATLNAGDIARLADVGRAAVSNWRRRHDDFPQPVGGTAASPLFSLPEIEAWLRRNGKQYAMSPGDRVWQRLRAAGDDLRLGELVAGAGTFLLYLRRDPDGWQKIARGPDPAARLREAAATATSDLPGPVDLRPIDARLFRLLADLAADQGPLAAFELLCERYAEAHSRQLAVTRPEVAGLMARLAGPERGTVLDPACGVGALLVPFAGRATGVLGQDLGETAAVLTAVRLLLRDAPARVVAGDSLRHDGFAGARADVVLCDPPFNERAWGYEELTGDPRWEYGLPPRGEPELAWVQHCLAHARPGGLVAVLMPAAAAGRRAGKRIRGNLLRAGALRAVVALAPGGPDLWLLRRPEPGARPPSVVLMMDAADDLAAVEPAWRAFSADPESALPGASRAVRIIDLLDDEVDLTPARHRPRRAGEDAEPGFGALRDRFRASTVSLTGAAPDLSVLPRGRDLPSASVAELVRAGLVTVLQGPPKLAVDTGEVPVLTSGDLTRGGPPTGRTSPGPGLVTLEPGDVVAAVTALDGAARAVTEGGAVLGPHLHLYRVDPDRLDPDFLAGCLRFAGVSGANRSHPGGGSRVDARRARIPRLSLDEQRAYGAAFRELQALQDALRETAALGESLVRAGLAGLVDGHLGPGGRPADPR